MNWTTIAGYVAAGLTLLTSGWIANTLSTMRLAGCISKTSKAALWIHGIHGIAEALDPLTEQKDTKTP
jgi:hypothetical protein